MVPYHYRIVHGTMTNFQEGSQIVRENIDERLCRNHTVVAVASLCSMVSDVTCWNAEKLDSILIEGDFMFYCIEEMLKEKSISSISSKTIVRFIQLGFKAYDPKNMSEFVHNRTVFGTFGSMLNKFQKYMKSTTNGPLRVLFKSKKVCFGIFDYIADDSSTEFCLFDPNGRDENGFYDYNSSSCILFFKKIENLFALLARDDLFNHTTCEFIPIQKIPIPASNATTEMLIFPFLRHSTPKKVTLSDQSDSSDEESTQIDQDMDATDVVRTRSGRKVEQPPKYQCESHPSFWRGKERQDAQNLKRNKIKFEASRTQFDIKKYNRWRRFRYKFKITLSVRK